MKVCVEYRLKYLSFGGSSTETVSAEKFETDCREYGRFFPYTDRPSCCLQEQAGFGTESGLLYCARYDFVHRMGRSKIQKFMVLRDVLSCGDAGRYTAPKTGNRLSDNERMLRRRGGGRIHNKCKQGVCCKQATNVYFFEIHKSYSTYKTSDSFFYCPFRKTGYIEMNNIN
jgi:hypothetical protein